MSNETLMYEVYVVRMVSVSVTYMLYACIR